LQSLALVGRAYQTVPKEFFNIKPIKQKPIRFMMPVRPIRHLKPNKLVRGFVDISIGTALLGPTSSLINKL
jgi:hypothetical protein